MNGDTPVYDQMMRELAAFPALPSPAKGDTYEWLGVTVTVTRVAGDGTWADVACELDGHTWTKRQPLPLPAEAELVTVGEPSTVDDLYDEALASAEAEDAAEAEDEPC